MVILPCSPCCSCDGPCPCRPGCCCGVVAADEDAKCIEITEVCPPPFSMIYPGAVAGQPVTMRLENVPDPINAGPWPVQWYGWGQFDYCSGRWVITVYVCFTTVGGNGNAMWRGVVLPAADCYPVAGPVTLYRTSCFLEGCNRYPQLTIDRP